MNNSYILTAFAGILLGMLVSLLPAFQKKGTKLKGFQTAPPVISSGVDEIKSKETYKSAESFGSEERRKDVEV